MFVFLEPRILLLGIGPTEIIRGTDQDLRTRKLITGLFITWKKLETTQPANSLGRRKQIRKLPDSCATDSSHRRPWFWWTLEETQQCSLTKYQTEQDTHYR